MAVLVWVAFIAGGFVGLITAPKPPQDRTPVIVIQCDIDHNHAEHEHMIHEKSLQLSRLRQ